ncbi:MAG: hypothetical protein H7343_12325 [Undibacterium sp.]|nr:hypothetical protein [Opitutaceae bacterium]
MSSSQPSALNSQRSGTAARRRDVFAESASAARLRGHARFYRALRQSGAPGVDSAGRFTGRGDVARAYDFFLKSRGLAPQPYTNTFGGEFGKGTTGGRPRTSNLTPEKLLAIDERARRGDKLSAIAQSYGLDRAIIAYALRPSPAMRRARAFRTALAA